MIFEMMRNQIYYSEIIQIFWIELFRFIVLVFPELKQQNKNAVASRNYSNFTRAKRISESWRK